MQGSEGMFEVLKAMQAIQTIITPLLRQGGQEAIVPQAEVRDIEDAVKRASSVARSYIQYTGRRLNRFRK